ncbi:MAG: hypothetical protein H6Q90_6037 [Deltaproteobacteria bacterium]|nr:hypothetical protein [Deltaproteobacteria bacterium]
MSNAWRTTAVVLGLACTWQAWRACTRPAPATDTIADCQPMPSSRSHARSAAGFDEDREPGEEREDAPLPAVPSAPGARLFGVPIPAWARSLTPQPGEDLRDYRDRMIPLAQLAVAPQRARISRSKEDFTKLANLDAQQVAALDATARETATAIQDRLFNAVLSGELSPSTFKPMAGVSVARDVLDLVDRASKKFTGSLREDQRGKLATHPFDFADYLVFSTRWEDAISGL